MAKMTQEQAKQISHVRKYGADYDQYLVYLKDGGQLWLSDIEFSEAQNKYISEPDIDIAEYVED